MLKLYNTRTRRKEHFVPLDPKNVRMYVCGPTVYDYAHIGNARPIIVFDLLFRLLRHFYGPEHVTYARNITDVDDKINARAAEEGVSIRELTERTTRQFHEDIRALGVLMPEDVNEPGKPPRFIEPRATEHIGEMIAMIEKLIERGHAYEAEGHVLFHVPSDPDYGQLARRSLDEMRAGARVEVAPYKRDPMDFVLWKPSKGNEPGWESPWGYGRPGWHLECSAMSDKWLWQEPAARGLLSEAGLAHPHVFDIHGGGIDLVFPHHENEVAQSTCAHGTDIMANIWMHNGFLQVEGEKMSKSLGNFITINELLKEWPGEAIRLAMLSSHYRQPMNWTAQGAAEARRTLDHWYELVKQVEPAPEMSGDFLQALADDLNTPRAIAVLHELASQAAKGSQEAAAALKASANLMGMLGSAEQWAAWRPAGFQLSEETIRARIEERLAARKARNWAEADRIRDELAAQGIQLKDSKDPETGEIVTTWEIAR